MGEIIVDSELIRQILSGQTESYDPLVLKYQRRVRGYCRSLLSNEGEAEEAAQEVFLKAYQALPKFRGDSSFSTWLYHITSNHCLDLLRKRNRRPTVSWDSLQEREGDRAQRFLSREDPSFNSFESGDLVEKILANLSLDYRNLLTLREVEALSYDEIAGILGCSIDAVRSRLTRARQALRDQLRHFSESPVVHITERRAAR